jgi:molecular chaperone DnaJ
MARDYYAVLGITTTAGLREIRQAYRRLARQCSPDVNLWDTDARTLYREITEAYRVLSDPTARSMYDRFGNAVASGRPAEGGRRGEDLDVTVELSLEDAARPTPLTLELNRFSPCGACQGAGCAACGGRGIRRAIERLGVTVSPGVDTGTEIRIAGEGHAGPHSGARGDLVVRTRVRDHAAFTRKGDNLHCEVPVTIGEAILGARIRVPTLTGEAMVVVPAGTQSGQSLRLRGQGLPHVFGEGAGDLYITVRVEIPTGLDVRTQALVRELDRLLGQHPRATAGAGGGDR